MFGKKEVNGVLNPKETEYVDKTEWKEIIN